MAYLNQQAAVHSELDNGSIGSATSNILFELDQNGKPTSLKGGVIVDESPNKSERLGVSLVKPLSSDRGTILRVRKQVFAPRIIEFEEADNTVPIDQLMKLNKVQDLTYL